MRNVDVSDRDAPCLISFGALVFRDECVRVTRAQQPEGELACVAEN